MQTTHTTKPATVNDIDRIFIFKTDIVSHDAFDRLKHFLETVDDVLTWNLDIQDCDHVLRIVSKEFEIDFYINEINNIGIFCEELPD